MVSALLADALADPTATLIALFDPEDALDQFPSKVSSYFSVVFGAPDALDEIPPLNVATPPEIYKERSLLRFRGMIQDTSFSPEMYLARRSGARCGGWGLGEDDPITGNQEEYINNIDMRTVIWAVTIPGESSWCAAQLDGEIAHSSAVHQPPYPHKFPIPRASHVGVQLKIYASAAVAESLKVSDLYNFVGIFTLEPLCRDIEPSSTALVPTLHVLFFLPLPSTILPRVYPDPNFTGVIREDLISWIADEGLGGDRLAAEWLLLCLISKPNRHSSTLALTISEFPSLPPDLVSTRHHVPTLSSILSQITPLLTTIPLTLVALNTSNFAPESRNEDLHSGWLQLPRGSICITSESGITEGTVQERGIMNIRAMQDLIHNQALQYVFPFSQFSFPTDIGFVVLTQGKKGTFLKTRLDVPLRPRRGFNPQFFYRAAADIALPSSQELNLYRSLVGGAKIGNVTVSEHTGRFIQNDFVEERKVAPHKQAVTSDDLDLRMTVARLLALSLHEKEITIQIWERAKVLIDESKSRLN